MTVDKKYELTEESTYHLGRKLYRIRALRDFGDYVKAGDLGGWIEWEDNLSHEGDCWVYEEARVYDEAKVYGDAEVCGSAYVYEYAKVYGSVRVGEDSNLCGNSRLCGIRWE
jgi:hypothetical protein